MIPLHGIASRHDLPLPFELIVVGGGIVLVLTFWVALFAWRRPRYEEEDGVPLPRLTRFVDSPAISRLARGVVAVIWLIAAASLFLGADRIDNPVFGFVFVLLWVGLVPMALLTGTSYRRTNPVRLLLRPLKATSPAPYDDRGSVAPAALALLVFLYLELVQPNATTLPVLRIFALGWLAWLVIGSLMRSQRWIAQADPFEAYATTVARLSFWARNRDRMLLWTNPLRNLASWHPPRHLGALAAVLLGGTLFDALSNTSIWVMATQELEGWKEVAVATVGLLASVALVYGLFWLGTRSYRGLAMDDLAPGLVPLVVGYCLAHYATMLYLEGQRTVIWFSDPLGRGWNLLGLAEAGPDTTLLAFPALIAALQVIAIVGGHALGVLVTHDIALRDSRATLRSHLPLLAIMVVFTMGGLLLMFG